MSTTTTGTNCDSCKPVISERTLHTPIPSSAWTAFIGGANYSTERGEHCPAHTHLWLCDFSFIIAVFYCLLDSIVALRHISTAFFFCGTFLLQVSVFCSCALKLRLQRLVSNIVVCVYSAASVGDRVLVAAATAVAALSLTVKLHRLHANYW